MTKHAVPFLLPTDSSQFYLPASRVYAEYFRRGGLQPRLSVFGVERATNLLIYADRTASTLEREVHDRKYAFPPELISRDPALYRHLVERQGWQVLPERKLVRIPSEDFRWRVSLDGNLLYLCPIPETAGAPGDPFPIFHYHLEYQYKNETDLSQWVNWVSLYIKPEDGMDLLDYIAEHTGYVPDGDFVPDRFYSEKKLTTGKREDMVFTTVTPTMYWFSYAGFTLAERFLREHGFTGEIPMIAYHAGLLEFAPQGGYVPDFFPVVKVGLVKTSRLQGDYDRHAQIAIKLAQLGARHPDGSRSRGVIRRLLPRGPHNLLAMPYRAFADALALALQLIHRQGFFESKVRSQRQAGVCAEGASVQSEADSVRFGARFPA